ncbi:hypothetical protein [Muricauda sp. MAR_2010_75]|uniref:hypothetical protein n=1 Tax=Allomuricauda sp. MAR_2010_75 TaxID=1250232 RepID=UPI0005622060|nr:hypothetical protein [Muricauda sp. MAR_2010_75]
MTTDFNLAENGSGGDITILGNDIAMTETLLQSAYLAMFGGNVESNTSGNELENEQRFDWWGNGLFHSQYPNKQFNSNTERALNQTPVTTSGRIEIERAVEMDLAFLKSVAEIDVQVGIVSHNSLSILITMLPYGNKQEKILQLLYDNAKNEIIIQKEI